jgi:uncharacterized protein YndB with AHSA1/START domain
MLAATMRTAAVAALATLAFAARADIRQSAPDSFLLSYTKTVATTPAKAFAAVVGVDRWWNPDHTYSGKSTNLSLKAEAGACFCETWEGNSVRHGTVIMALRDQMLRLEGALGPLQSMALNGILTIGLKADGDNTTVTMIYRVNGVTGSALDKMAPNVDAMLSEQFSRLTSVMATGKPTSP